MTKPTMQPAGRTARRPTGVFGSPPRLTADTDAKRAIDLVLPIGAWRYAFFIAIAVGISAADQLPNTPGLVLGAATTLVAGGYCMLNFWRCREAHCIISGTGWAALGLFEAAEIVLGHSLIHRNEGAVFVAILIVAVVFEAYWRTRHGSNAIKATDRCHS